MIAHMLVSKNFGDVHGPNKTFFCAKDKAIERRRNQSQHERKLGTKKKEGSCGWILTVKQCLMSHFLQEKEKAERSWFHGHQGY